jgi:hypothetical protein
MAPDDVDLAVEYSLDLDGASDSVRRHGRIGAPKQVHRSPPPDA